MSETLRILFVVVLVAGNALFVAAEYALVTARRARLEERARSGSRSARVALDLMDEPVRFISTVQVGITVFSILLGAIGEPLVSDLFGGSVPRWVSFLVAFLTLTYLSVVLGELVPKAVALERAERLAIFLAVPLQWLGRILHPLVWVLDKSASAVARLLGVPPARAGLSAHTEEDIRHLVAEAEDVGAIETAEEEMVYKVFDFADKEADEVMVSRPQVVALSVDLPTQEALAAVIDSPFTRYPVFRGSIDDVLGILHVRDLFKALYDRGLENVVLEELVRPAYVVPETKDLAALLAEFRKTNQHMAIVVDEYGGVAGIVTLEDLLEEIVGEIEDEYDLPDESVERLDESRIRIDGTFPIDDFNEEFKQELPQEDFHTVAGFVFGQLGRAPEEGDEIVWNGLRFNVVDVDGQRIGRLQVDFLEPEDEPEPVEAE
ncbi:MAG: HlyC/CorC family transporter [Actinobacteria bacterium]|nr:HlyC/CorC family transporter [Actinomycetota bacterium]